MSRMHHPRTAKPTASPASPDWKPPLARTGVPLDAATRSTLEPGFGHSLSGIRIFADDHANQLSQDFNADAFTVGQDIFFAQGRYAPGSEDGRHLLAHEVAHAVQQRGAQADDFRGLAVPDRHSRSETEAHAAAHAVTRGRPAQVSASAGPTVSRWESGEHKHAVDDANLPPGMGGRIKLANGMMATPGEVTAMMGDLYAKYDKDGHFDPAASFQEMNSANPEEMRHLIHMIDDEAAHPDKLKKASEWGAATQGRPKEDRFLEIAEKNNAHFSAPDAKGNDNNMGAYGTFHQMALDAAKNGDMEKARALEASADHFLTDRFSAGHSIEKNGVMDASPFERNSDRANGAVKIAHDEMNKNGAMLHDAHGANWMAYGDGKWADDGNRDNRVRTEQAVSDSWAELARADPSRAHSPAEQAAKFDVAGEVPQFDWKNQKRAEDTASGTSTLGEFWHFKGEILDHISGSPAPIVLPGQDENWDAQRDANDISLQLGELLDTTDQEEVGTRSSSVAHEEVPPLPAGRRH